MAKTSKKKPAKEKPISRHDHERLKHERAEAIKRASEQGEAIVCMLELLLGLNYHDEEVMRGVDEFLDDDEEISIDDEGDMRGAKPGAKPVISQDQWTRAKVLQAFGVPREPWQGTTKDISIRDLERHIERRLTIALAGTEHAFGTVAERRATMLARKLLKHTFDTGGVKLGAIAPFAVAQIEGEKEKRKRDSDAKKTAKKKAAKKTAKKKAASSKVRDSAGKSLLDTASKKKSPKKTAKKAAKKTATKPAAAKPAKASGTANAAEQLGERVLGRMRSIGKPVGVDELANVLGVSRPTILRALKVLKAAKKATSTGGGRSTKWQLLGPAATSASTAAAAPPPATPKRDAPSMVPPGEGADDDDDEDAGDADG